jgi:hypothetical protein
VIDLTLRPHNFFSSYLIEGKEHLDRDAISIKKLQAVFRLYHYDFPSIHHEVIANLSKFKRLVVDEPVNKKIGDWIILNLLKINKVEVKNHDISTGYFLARIATKKDIDFFYYPQASFPFDYATSESRMLDFGSLCESLDHLETNYSALAALELFSHEADHYKGIDLGIESNGPYFDWLIQYEKQFEVIFFSQAPSEGGGSLEKIQALINLQRGLRSLSFPMCPLVGSSTLDYTNLSTLNFIDLLGESFFTSENFASLFSHASELDTLFLPKIIDPVILDLVEERLPKLKSIGIRSPTSSLGMMFPDFLKRMDSRLESVLITLDARLNLRILQPSLHLKRLELIDCLLESHSTILSIGALYPNLERLSLQGTEIRAEEVSCFRLLYPHVHVITN